MLVETGTEPKQLMSPLKQLIAVKMDYVNGVRVCILVRSIISNVYTVSGTALCRSVIKKLLTQSLTQLHTHSPTVDMKCA